MLRKITILSMILMLGVFGYSANTKVNSKVSKIVTENAKVTFIELGSVKCVPCKMMQPVMKQVEEKYPDQVKVVFYDVWTKLGEPFGQAYNIRVIPTQVFLDSKGNEYARHEGYFPYEELLKVLEEQGVK